MMPEVPKILIKEDLTEEVRQALASIEERLQFITNGGAKVKAVVPGFELMFGKHTITQILGKNEMVVFQLTTEPGKKIEVIQHYSQVTVGLEPF